ncbi:MAG TPA: hypothetical protein VFP50_15550 [Anaeromyxobacteraceae bacterium]|nr:hypothetical protein [Anaeromyxobacteraceae bacterium]
MTPVLEELIAVCAVCGQVACERDLFWVTDPDMAATLEVQVNDTVCAECGEEA